MSVSAGDQVQIKDGGIDVTNGYKAKAGKLYGEGGPLFGKVEKVVDNWNTGGKFGLAKTVTKVRITDTSGKTVVWQVRPEDVAENKVVDEPPPPPDPPPPEPPPDPPEPIPEPEPTTYEGADIGVSNVPYAMQYGSNKWDVGRNSVQDDVQGNVSFINMGLDTIDSGELSNHENNTIHPYTVTNAFGSDSVTKSLQEISQPSKKLAGANQLLTSIRQRRNAERNRTPIRQLKTDKSIFPPSITDSKFRDAILDENIDLIKNAYNYPRKVANAHGMYAAKYDYATHLETPLLYNGPTTSLQDKLMELRASVGIPVHGNANKARSMKYYMYNRMKVPDTNMAPVKMFTHVFFTRPDLYLLQDSSNMTTQARNHTDTALLWRQYPEIFKMLTDRKRCNDENNFNMLLSNQIQSFHLHDEKLATKDAGTSWTKQTITYGDSYTGRGADTFDCQFLETSDLSVINMIKLWMLYIDNVHTGAWSPNYGVLCHMYDRALDYASSVYVFKTGPDGEEVLYWSKYYGVFPINTGASILSWETGDEPGKVLTPSIEFAYSYKKDRSPISLLEFNDAAVIQGNQIWEPSYSHDYNHANRPYVGTPYIEIDLGEPSLSPNDVGEGKRTSIRLKFKKDESANRSDEVLFKAS